MPIGGCVNYQIAQSIRWLRQAGALFGLVTIFNFGIIQRVEAISCGIEFTSESYFSDCVGFISISHISEEEEQQGAGSNIILAEIHEWRARTISVHHEPFTAFEYIFVADNGREWILRERKRVVFIKSDENCISFDQNSITSTNINNPESHRYGMIGGSKKTASALRTIIFGRAVAMRASFAASAAIRVDPASLIVKIPRTAVKIAIITVEAAVIPSRLS